MNKKPWYRSHKSLEPNFKVLPNYRGSILLLHGELDDQVPLSEAILLASILQGHGSGHPDFTLKVFPGLGHGFAPPKDGWRPTVGPIDPKVLDYLSHWTSTKF